VGCGTALGKKFIKAISEEIKDNCGMGNTFNQEE